LCFRGTGGLDDERFFVLDRYSVSHYVSLLQESTGLQKQARAPYVEVSRLHLGCALCRGSLVALQHVAVSAFSVTHAAPPVYIPPVAVFLSPRLRFVALPADK
jgi:hypothetical protein